MTNEELVKLIQAGERDKLPLLWEGVRGFVAKTAYSYIVIFDGRYGVELDDLIQAGFIAMVKAAETYLPGDAKFLTWLTYHLKTAFAEAAGRRTERQRKDPLQTAESLYTPISDDGDGVLLDELEDPVDPIDEFENREYNVQLHSALEDVLATIPQYGADVLRLHFFHDLPLTQIAESRGVSTEAISAKKRDGLNAMRRKVNTRLGAKLKAFIEGETKYYTGMGLSRFNTTLTSPIEAAVIWREGQMERAENAVYTVPQKEHMGIYHPDD